MAKTRTIKTLLLIEFPNGVHDNKKLFKDTGNTIKEYLTFDKLQRKVSKKNVSKVTFSYNNKNLHLEQLSANFNL